VLNRVLFTRGYTTRHKNKLIINPTASYLFEFNDLDNIYFKKTGNYMIRFTLLKKYGSKYMTKSITTDWIYFNVKVPEKNGGNFSPQVTVAHSEENT
jgi:hypothetical protein